MGLFLGTVLSQPVPFSKRLFSLATISSSFHRQDCHCKAQLLHKTGYFLAAVQLGGAHFDPHLRPDPGVRFDHPLIPDTGVVSLPPDADFQLGILREVKRCLSSKD